MTCGSLGQLLKRVISVKFPVTRDPKNLDDIILLDMNDVVSVQSWDRSIVFHTLDGEYFPVTPRISTLEKHLETVGFRRLDRTNLVNMHKVKRYDDKRSVVFFEDSVTTTSKYCTVSHSEKALVKKMITRENPLPQNEYREGGGEL